MTPLARLARTRLALGTAAGFYGLGVQLLVQLISVPVLTRQWGVAGYGIWLLLFSVPSLLAMADLGLTTAGANAMTDAVARGDPPKAARIHSALRVITLLTGGVLLALAALLLYVLRPGALDFAEHMAAGQARTTAMLLCCYGLLALVNGVTLAAYRAADAFALSNMLYQTMILFEAVAALGTAIGGGDPEQVALAYLLGRMAGTVMLSLGIRRRAPWLGRSDWRADRGELRELIRPALAALVYPGANAIAMQGSVMVIGAIGGPAAIPAYAVVRTLSRTALQFAMRFNIAAMPRYTVFIAQDDQPRARQLVALNLLVAAGLVIPAAVLLFAFGQPFIHLWTGGTIEPGLPLLGVMVLTMLANAAWGPLSNLMLAINRHAAFTYYYLGAALVCLALGAALTVQWPTLGMALAMLVMELLMVGRVWHLARAMGMLDLSGTRLGLTEMLRELRADRTSAKDSAP